MYQYSMTQWVSGREPLEKTVNRLKTAGYDAIELSAEPYQDLEKIKRVLAEYRFPCSSLCGIFPKERNLSSSDIRIRKNAVSYVKASVEMATEMGCKTVIVVPSAVGCQMPEKDYETAWKNSVESLKEAAEYAEKKDVFLAVEAINRFETFLVNDAATSRKFVEEIDNSHVKMMLDLFHMNIEERDFTKAIRIAAPYLVHVHLADNTREPVGMGQIPLPLVYQTLQEISYQGYLTMEFMPRVANPYQAAEKAERPDIFDEYARKAIEYCRKTEEKLKKSNKSGKKI